MTIEEYILSRSYLPKNGTYTMVDHIKAMLMGVSGSFVKIVVDTKVDKINVKETTTNIGIKENVVKIIVKETKKSVGINEIKTNVRVS